MPKAEKVCLLNCTHAVLNNLNARGKAVNVFFMVVCFSESFQI